MSSAVSIPLAFNPNDSRIYLIRVWNRQRKSLFLKPPRVRLSVKSASTPDGSLQAGDIFRKLAVSAVLLLGVGLSRCAFASSPIPRTVAPSIDHRVIEETDNVEKSEKIENAEDEEINAGLERWKSKTYALSVTLRIVALFNSFPPAWLKDFMQSQGTRVKVHQEFRQSLQDIFFELRIPCNHKAMNPKAALSADLVTLGDSWLSFAIKEGLIEPMQGVKGEDWFRNLTEKWKE